MPKKPPHDTSGVGLQAEAPNEVKEKEAFIRLTLDYRTIHSRRYSKEYHLPNDEREQIRQSIQHEAYTQIMGRQNSLHTAPIASHPTHILDIGTGTGEWAIDVAERYPTCSVMGTDISAIAQRKDVPVNVNFEIEDAEAGEERPANKYDLVHLRGMAGAFRDWIYIYDSVLDSLKPGGWVEVQDVTGIADLFMTSFGTETPTFKLFSDLKLAAAASGRKQDDAHLEPPLLWDAGFKEVNVTETTVPLGASLGELWLITILDGIEAMSLRLLTKHMGWGMEECKDACERSARELAMLVKDPARSGDMSLSIRTVIGRKPL